MKRRFTRLTALIIAVTLMFSSALYGCSSSKTEEAPTAVAENSTGNSSDKNDSSADGSGAKTESSAVNAEDEKADGANASDIGDEKADSAADTSDQAGGPEADKSEASNNQTGDGDEAQNGPAGDDKTGNEAAEAGSNPYAGAGTGEVFDLMTLKEGLANGTLTMQKLSEMTGMSVKELEALLGEDGSNIDQLMAMYGGEPQNVGELAFPSDTTEYSQALAIQALQLCTGHGKQNQAAMLLANDFEIVAQANYDKDPADDSHTCAYTVGKKTVSYKGEDRTLLVIAIRGTNAGEWFSNFDFSDTHEDETTIFADNFLSCAQAISVELIPVFMENPDSLILICGHSRGAAAANLLGMLLNETKGKENIFCYTYATPNTYRGEEERENCDNIFNIINPCDMVTKMPLTGLGYRHIGNDIVLYGDPEAVKSLDDSFATMFSVSPSIKEYYEARHSLLSPGLSEDGMTAYEVMLAVGASMVRTKTDKNGGVDINELYASLDANPMSATSDLAPLFGELKKLFGGPGSVGMGIFAQHMPAVYLQLLGAFEFADTSGEKR
ncbi:MAG: hypothetical protein MJ131_03595 [Lachnospiraceae bacterium]|nr:hypothetical protein [Lachnospiraceae bacterium]